MRRDPPREVNKVTALKRRGKKMGEIAEATTLKPHVISVILIAKGLKDATLDRVARERAVLAYWMGEVEKITVPDPRKAATADPVRSK